MKEIPLSITGSPAAPYCTASSFTVSARGTRLRTLFKVAGQPSRSPTAAQSQRVRLFGSLKNSFRRISTARISHPAAMLRFKRVKNTSAIAYSSFTSSIILRSSSASAAVSRLPLVNAARNAGREPSKVSSTNCRLCFP